MCLVADYRTQTCSFCVTALYDLGIDHFCMQELNTKPDFHYVLY